MSGAGETRSSDFGGPLALTRAATAVLDGHGTVLGWSPAAQKLLGHTPADLLGSPAARLLADTGQLPPPEPGGGTHGRTLGVRHRDGHVVQAAVTHWPLPTEAGREPSSVLLLARADEMREWETRQAVLQALLTQSPIGLTIYDTAPRVVWTNDTCSREMVGPPELYAGRYPDELVPGGEVISPEHSADLRGLVRRVLDSGEPVIDLHYRGRPPEDPTHDRIWSYSYYRLLDARGLPIGVCEESFDITERYRAEQRLHLLVKAGEHIGTTLDPYRTAAELADVAVPKLADFLAVDLLAEVLEGREPLRAPTRDAALARVASRGAAPPGAVASGPDAASERTLILPLRTRDLTLGLVTFARAASGDAFSRADIVLADELTRRTAVCLDNARRYAGEHRAALTLQRELLPGRLPPRSAVESAHRYLPADSRVGVGGDWFDVIPLSGARVGLVVGDVVGHGLRAAATMGRLRTTVRALAQLDLAPEELLTQLDDLVAQSVDERAAEGDASLAMAETPGGTCLYGVYDPVTRTCVLARAGHLHPVVVAPDGTADIPDLPSGPPLGTGGVPFESAHLTLAEGSLLALFTDGLVEARDLDVEEGLRRLTDALTHPAEPLEDLCDTILTTLPSRAGADDAALLLVRTRGLDPDDVASWELPTDPAAVPALRHRVREQLHTWGLEAHAFTTELVASELLANALRHASGPVHLRLIRDRTLICEVSDTSHTSPHVRHAASDDEGGRGLFLVSQTTQRWGTRYTPSGKVIWAEQPLPGP
ncbi:SpoIIE family protein phosphatase [Streptomyces sp. JJ66]|uniref:SpoIIE family protein phosphatase n=1 Tax=Streptomyces sp. JJ66 TaxID=2803843 RepID=UPI001C586DAA|nr:SpoIIE family protein phosphatase [Streptomyces sp. JJ66]MBW1601004.1 SpoIIE family protein phosphatase [Streptomyces sp. JJ66]